MLHEFHRKGTVSVTRSSVAITRLLVLPYAVLLMLYLAVIGGGGSWLYLQVRAVEAQLLIEEIRTVVAPLGERLGSLDALAAIDRAEPWLVAEVAHLFAKLPALRGVSVRDRSRGLELRGGAGSRAALREVAPLSTEAERSVAPRPAAERLQKGPGGEFRLAYDLGPESAPVRLAFDFDRSMLLARVDAGLASIRRAVLIFGLIGGLSILVAVGITAYAMHRTRRIEAHFQQIDQRASLTELAAELVHDLRNPLMALRANAQALSITPEQAPEIISELDRDIVALNDKLNAFLRLTRPHEAAAEPVDVPELIRDAVRLAEPVLAQHGLSAAVDVPPSLPRPVLQREAVRDALLNVIVNAAQSGQAGGAVQIGAAVQGEALTISVEDCGAGIAEEHLPRLFDPFYTTKPGGNGLGLAIVQRIVADHQGQVRAENRARGGARILLTLPLRPKEVPYWWKALRKSGRT